jgi:hypothetical protein
MTLVCTDSITPSGTSYNARFIPTQGAPWTETWTPATGTTTVRAMRATTVPTPTATFQPGQIALAAGRLLYGSSTGVATSLAAGTNGHVLTLDGGYPTWAAAGGGVTSVFGRSGAVTATTGDYTAAQVTGAVAGSASLTTAGAVPYVASSGTLAQDTALNWDATNNRLGIGAITSAFNLDVSGSSSTARIYDQTATTGSTLFQIRAGAGQSGDIFIVYANNGTTKLFYNDQNGRPTANDAYYIGASGAVWNQTNAVQSHRSDGTIVFSSTTNALSAKDTGIARNAAGVLEVNNGTAGTYRDITFRIAQWRSGTEATCSSSTRGQVVMVQGGAGVADTLRVCRKDNLDAYAWVALY